MKKLSYLFAILLASAQLAFADGTNGTKTVSVAATSTLVEAASDVQNGRNYIFLQNLSATATATCTIGIGAATTTTGISLAPLASWTNFAIQSPNGRVAQPPNGDIYCISSTGTIPVVVITY